MRSVWNGHRRNDGGTSERRPRQWFEGFLSWLAGLGLAAGKKGGREGMEGVNKQ